MSGGTRRPAGGHIRSLAVAMIAAFALLGGVLVPTATPQRAVATTVETQIRPTADLSKFQAGNIISDAVFFDSGTMSEAQIQAFLEQKVPTCQAGYTCLKDWYDTSRSTAKDAMCEPYAGGYRERASAIIAKVAQACGINPQVILATLQKEQSLVTHVWPSEWRYTSAMGQGCPDTAACDTRYYGFFNQVYGAAWQFKRYANPPGTSQYFTWYAPFNTWDILYNPDRGCSSSRVYIANQATANLYYYTPYQPNAAALRAGYGEGDGCSAYGNRNFYNYFTDWFGSTQVVADPCRAPSDASVTVAGGEFTVSVAALNARRGPSTDCGPVVRSLPQGTAVTRLGVWGDWWKIRLDGVVYWVSGTYLSAAPAVAYSTQRVAGATRYETSVEVSKAAYPAGAGTVLLASGEDFPDALSAAAAAGHADASLLLTQRDGLSAAVRDEILRLRPMSVIVVGGADRVSDGVLQAVAALVPGATVERVAGSDRYETSRLIASRFFVGATAAYVVTGRKFADAVVAAGLGGASGRPVVLVDGASSTLDGPTAGALRAAGITSVTIAGDVASVSAGIESALRSQGIQVARQGGNDRYETSRLLSAAAYPNGSGSAVLATGIVFPDALTGAVLAAQRSAPVFTAPGTCLPGATKDWLMRSRVNSVSLIGGEPSLSAAVAASERC